MDDFDGFQPEENKKRPITEAWRLEFILVGEFLAHARQACGAAVNFLMILSCPIPISLPRRSRPPFPGTQT
jgi:hypothetical protein